MTSLTIETIESPKTFFTGTMRDDLIERLTRVARSGFGTEITRDDVELHAFDGDFMHLVSRDGEVVGFSTYKRFIEGSARVLHFNGTVFDRAVHRNGLYTLSRVLALSEERPDFITFRTQNPVIYGIARKLVREINPGAGAIAPKIEAIARHIGGPTMESGTLVVRGFYGTQMYDTIPRHSDVNELFDKHLCLDYARGDAVIGVGRVK